LWQADIVEMHPYSSINRSHYIFTVFDVLNKLAWAVPFKSKGGNKMAGAIAEIVRKKMSENFTNGYGERVLQRCYVRNLKKTMLITIPRIRH